MNFMGTLPPCNYAVVVERLPIPKNGSSEAHKSLSALI